MSPRAVGGNWVCSNNAAEDHTHEGAHVSYARGPLLGGGKDKSCPYCGSLLVGRPPSDAPHTPTQTVHRKPQVRTVRGDHHV